MQLALTLATLFAYAHAGAVELTADNFESSIAGKGAFIKFLAPW
jgi:hypothetical protein